MLTTWGKPVSITDMPSPDSRPGSPNSPLLFTWLPDVIAVVLIIVLWWCWLYPEVSACHPVAYDAFRDAAGAENVLAGRWFRDPMTAGQTYWYAPLGPVIFAGLSCVTGQAPLMAYSTSILWLNLLLPIGWYALARYCWGWPAGVAAVPLVWLGSRWWSTHMVLPMTSIQGVAVLTGVLLAWLVALQRRRRWAVVVGVLLAGCTWYHTISGIIAAVAIGFHALAGAESLGGCGSPPPAPRHREAILRMLIVAGVCALLVMPLAWHLLSLLLVNSTPIEHLGGELRDSRFAWQTHAWLIFPLATVGLVSVRKRLYQPAGLIVGYGLIALVGQGLGYLRLLTDVAAPVLIPHEFQWNFQIAVGLLAACGAARVATGVTSRGGPRMPGRRMPRALVTLLVTALAVGHDLRPALERKSGYWRTSMLSTERAAAVDWIKQNTSIDDVFLASEPLNYLLVAGRTGRKIVCPPKGYANIALPVVQRIEDRARMLLTSDPAELRTLLVSYQVRYVLLGQGNIPHWDRWRSSGLFETVLGAGSRALVILRVRPPALDPPPSAGAAEPKSK